MQPQGPFPHLDLCLARGDNRTLYVNMFARRGPTGLSVGHIKWLHLSIHCTPAVSTRWHGFRQALYIANFEQLYASSYNYP